MREHRHAEPCGRLNFNVGAAAFVFAGTFEKFCVSHLVTKNGCRMMRAASQQIPRNVLSYQKGRLSSTASVGRVQDTRVCGDDDGNCVRVRTIQKQTTRQGFWRSYLYTRPLGGSR